MCYGFQKLEPEQNRQTQTDATEDITTPHSRVVMERFLFSEQAGYVRE